MNRRTFLATASAALANSPRRGTPPQQDTRKAFKKALKFGMIGGDASVLDKFRLAKSVGFDGVEMDSPSKIDRDEVVRARDATGIAIPGVVDAVHWSRPLSHGDVSVRAEGRKALEGALRDCKFFGGTTVLLVPAVVNKGVGYDRAWDRSIAEIRKVLPLAAELDVTIAIENVWNQFLLSPLEAARYVDLFESPHVGFHFDVGNVVNFWFPEHWIEILGKRIRKLDVKEFSRKKRDELGLWKGFDVEIGDGDCDWPSVRAALARIGYSGWATAEVAGGDATRLADVARRMEAVLNG